MRNSAEKLERDFDAKYMRVVRKVLTTRHPDEDKIAPPTFMWLCAIALALLLIASCTTSYASCSRDIDELKPETRRVYNDLEEKAKAKGITFKIICGFRTQETQDRLYAQGRSLPGKKVTWTRRSRHTKGIAFDIAIFKGGRVSWKGEDYLQLGKIGTSLGLTWGGDWKVRDYGHFELGT